MQARSPALRNIPVIPAMTTDEERQCYYRLVKEGAKNGAVIEFGAWLGASTAYIAAGIRDAKVATKAKVFDRFLSKPGHITKVERFYAKKGIEGDAMPLGSCFEKFKQNLGPLMDYVDAKQAEIAQVQWGDDPIAVLISDAPKRVPEISAVLTNLRGGLHAGAVMAWQDFCHFPSYEIPACLYRLRDKTEFVEAIVPGTTLVFRVTEQFDAREVSREHLAVHRWSPFEVEQAWDYWLDSGVPAEKASLFRCGAALFLCDIGYPDAAVETLAKIYADDAEAIVPKWQYIHEARSLLVSRYQPLFDYLARQGVLG